MLGSHHTWLLQVEGFFLDSFVSSSPGKNSPVGEFCWFNPRGVPWRLQSQHANLNYFPKNALEAGGAKLGGPATLTLIYTITSVITAKTSAQQCVSGCFGF